jgi:oligoendopeptidase F
VDALTEHLEKVFQSHPSENEPEEEEAFTQLQETHYQREPPISSLKIVEVQEVINSLKS